MSDTVVDIESMRFEGYVTVFQADPLGMIAVRGDLASKPFSTALKKAIGIDLPKMRQIAKGDTSTLAWMSPDELLILSAWEHKTRLMTVIQKALGKRHSMVVDVSDGRMTFTLKGSNVREVIAKLAPVDLSPAGLEPGEVRRTRFGQISAAFWLVSQEEATVICFRSFGDYMFKQLKAAATPGSELDIWS